MARTVTFFLRHPSLGVSHERLYRAIHGALPATFEGKIWNAPTPRLSFRAILANMIAARKEAGDVNHITAGLLSYLTFALPGRSAVVTINDCAGLHSLRGWKRRAWRYFWHELPLRRAAHVVTISEATRRDLLGHLDRSPRRVTVIPACLPPGYEKAAPKPFNAAKPIILQVGTKPNKNLSRVISAITGLSCSLRIIGPLSDGDRASLAASSIEYSNAVSLSDEQMREQYVRCDILVFASTFEGFGMPIIEAQAIGRPVVTSDKEPMRTVAGGAALLVDESSPASIRQAIEHLINDADVRQTYIDRGVSNARSYSAQATAERYAQVYEDTLAFRHGRILPI